MASEPETLPAVQEAPRELLNVETGEVLPATTENAAAVLVAAREMKNRLGGVIRDAEAFLADESRRLGTKTFHTGGGKVSLSGGMTTSYDPEVLGEALRAAGCPEERISEAIVEEVTYKVNQTVLRQLASANPAYRAAAEKAKIESVTPIRASVK